MELLGKSQSAAFGMEVLKDLDIPGSLYILLGTYADDEAAQRLQEMRDWFWGDALPRAAARVRR